MQSLGYKALPFVPITLYFLIFSSKAAYYAPFILQNVTSITYSIPSSTNVMSGSLLSILFLGIVPAFKLTIFGRFLRLMCLTRYRTMLSCLFLMHHFILEHVMQYVSDVIFLRQTGQFSSFSITLKSVSAHLNCPRWRISSSANS